MLFPCLEQHKTCNLSVSTSSLSPQSWILTQSHQHFPPYQDTLTGHTETSSASPHSQCVYSSQVKRQLERLNRNMDAGPDGVNTRVLKIYAEQLCGILQHLFNLSLNQEKVPVQWKTPYLVTVPKKITCICPQ